MGFGWMGKRIGVNHDPTEAQVKIKNIEAGINVPRNAAGIGLSVKCSFIHLRNLMKRIPKKGVRVRLAQKAKRS